MKKIRVTSMKCPATGYATVTLPKGYVVESVKLNGEQQNFVVVAYKAGPWDRFMDALRRMLR